MKTTTITPGGTTSSRKPLRIWPGVVLAAAIVLMRFVVPAVFPQAAMAGLFSSVAGAALIAVWWLFFSRAAWVERIGAIGLAVVATLLTRFVVHPSVATGMMGLMVPLALVPSTLAPFFVAAVALTRGHGPGIRRAAMAAAIVAGCGVWTLVRTDGIKGESGAQLSWRWTPTAEERLLAQGDDTPAVLPQPQPHIPAIADTPPAAPTAPSATQTREASPAAKEPAAASAAAKTPDPSPAPGIAPGARVEWPGFRGAARDSVSHHARLETDWSKSAPVQLWRKAIGPGWSSFAVAGGFIYTQEQRGEHEVVSAYRFGTGEPVWRHRDPVRFYESNGGAGPRGTPTLHNGRLYTLGATGIVNALDAATGAVVWSRNAQADTGATLPGWGFAASPLVVDDLVIVAASGRLAGYAIATGTPRWTRATGGGGYSSPQLAILDGVQQVLLMNGGGVTSVDPADGAILWESKGLEGVSIVQPALLTGADVLVAAGDMMGGTGIRRVTVSKASGAWKAEERWTSRGLKPYFNDYVVHEGHAFGFDGTILACISLEDGERKWKGGRYGAGQMLLLPDQDLLLVVSEEGELALVSGTPDKFTELARWKAIEGKTWNHPVLVGDTLLVRNGEEMAAFRLPLAAR